MHSNHGRITGLNLDQLKLIQAAFAGQALPRGHPDALQIRFIREVCSCHSNLPGFRHLECPDPKPRLEGKKLHHTLTALRRLFIIT
jgi:hypothetical protein